MADIAQQHLFLAQHLLSVSLCAMVIIVMYNGSTGVMPQRGRRHWRGFQVMANVVDVLWGVLCLFRKVDFPATLELDLKKLAPLPTIPNVFIAGGEQIQLSEAFP